MIKSKTIEGFFEEGMSFSELLPYFTYQDGFFVLKDGSLGLLFLLAFSLISFAAGRIKAENLLLLSNEDFILIEMFLLSLAFLLKKEKLFAKAKKPLKSFFTL